MKLILVTDKLPPQDCTEKSFCDGTAAVCPKPDKKEDNRTECNGGTQVSTHSTYYTIYSQKGKIVGQIE